MAIVLPAAVTAYLTTVQNSLKDHASDDATVDVAPIPYIRAMHLSAALDLIQNALDQTSSLTVVSGTTRSLTDGASTFVAGSMIGNYVTFGSATTTVALRGLSYRVHSNTTTTLTFNEDLAGTPVAGDVYTIRAGLLDDLITDLREGKGLGDSPGGDIYGDNRLVHSGIVKAIRQLGATLAEPTLFSGVTGTGSTTTSIVLNNRGSDFRIDQFRGMKLTVTGSNPVKITQNDDDTCTVSSALSGGAPAAGVAVTVKLPLDSSDFMSSRDVHPGAPQSGYRLANMLAQLQAAVEAFTLPT